MKVTSAQTPKTLPQAKARSAPPETSRVFLIFLCFLPPAVENTHRQYFVNQHARSMAMAYTPVFMEDLGKNRTL